MSTRVVYKYALPTAELVRVETPIGSRPVHFAEQHGQLQVWIDQSTNNELEPETHEFLIRGTGHPYSAPGWRHIASTLVNNGDFVFHLYGRVV